MGAAHRTHGAGRRHAWLIVAAAIALFTIASASPASAATSGAQAWGANSSGELGDGTTEGPEKCGPEAKPCSTTPVQVGELSGVTAVSAGLKHSLALLEDGTVMAWGSNDSGQLGNGTKTSSDVPIAVSGLNEVKAVSAGSHQSLALLKNGTVMAWGEDPGNGAGSSLVPVTVSGLSGVVAIAAGGGGFDYSLALLEDGRVMAWGNNTSGQLGNGTTESSEVPVEVKGLSGPVTAIAAGEAHSLALLSDGTVMNWGVNGLGELGNGTETPSSVPVAVTGLGEVTAIAGGGYHSLALLSNGTVKAWGDNLSGQLGDGTSTGPEGCGELKTACAKVPVAVSGLSGVAAVAGGEFHSLALLKNGKVEAWGNNEKGQLGDGTSTGPEACGVEGSCSTTPVEVGKLTGVQGVAAGGRHSLVFGPLPPPPTTLPEVGRCVKVPVGKGVYVGSSCVSVAKPGTGRYEWTQVSATEKQTFAGAGGETTFRIAGHPTIKCVVANVTGEWRGPKTATVEIEFQGCKNTLEEPCQSSPPNKTEIKTFPLEAGLGFIKNQVNEGKPTVNVGLDLKPQAPLTELASFECGSTGSGQPVRLEGSVIGEIKPLNRMTTLSNLVFRTRSSGAQLPEAFEGGETDTLVTTYQSGLESSSAATTMKIKEEAGHYAAPLEIKAK